MDQGLQLNSGANDTETHQVQRVVVKEEDIKEEEHEHMIAYQDDDEMPFTEHDCKTEADGAETDVTESSVTYDDETPQQTAEIEVKIEEDDEQELGDLLASVSEGQNRMQQRIHGQNDDELNLRLRGRLHHCAVCRKSFKALTELKSHMLTHSARTTVKIEVKKEDDEHDYLLESGSEHLPVTQQKIHGQNDELNLQLEGRLHHCTICRKSFTALKELKKHQQTHTNLILKEGSLLHYPRLREFSKTLLNGAHVEIVQQCHQSLRTYAARRYHRLQDGCSSWMKGPHV
ncbi:hypothetical protein AALO_G00092170 [Alosa alosa]|uniref:C2H2-type domain-containing protein n=1 Tax=Alosa alosa TaxID=278164 RepID=A0AAV6GSD1_9TELE|nr:hypothetical protein AALO_G00092170 [Alosa alosa]